MDADRNVYKRGKPDPGDKDTYPVHFDAPDQSPRAQQLASHRRFHDPLCRTGDWHCWLTEDPAAVTCVRCLALLEASGTISLA